MDLDLKEFMRTANEPRKQDGQQGPPKNMPITQMPSGGGLAPRPSIYEVTPVIDTITPVRTLNAVEQRKYGEGPAWLIKLDGVDFRTAGRSRGTGLGRDNTIADAYAIADCDREGKYRIRAIGYCKDNGRHFVDGWQDTMDGLPYLVNRDTNIPYDKGFTLVHSNTASLDSAVTNILTNEYDHRTGHKYSDLLTTMNLMSNINKSITNEPTTYKQAVGTIDHIKDVGRQADRQVDRGERRIPDLRGLSAEGERGQFER